MYAGRIAERADVDSLFANPRHPYTLGLLESVPRWDSEKGDSLQAIPGQPPHLVNLPAGCSFYERCTYREDGCRERVPDLVNRPDDGQFACLVNVDQAKRKELA